MLRVRKSSWIHAAVLGCLCMMGHGSAADLVGISPITNKLVRLHFDEGYVEFTPQSSTAHRSAFDITNGKEASSYSIKSADDSEYSSATNPSSVSRKSRVAETAKVGGVIFDHFIFLSLPKPLQSGKSYTVTVGSLAENLNDTTFTFDEYRIRSEVIHVNQIGYVPTAGKKFAYVSQWAGEMGGVSFDAYDGATFHVVDAASRESQWSGTLKLRKDFETGGRDNGFENNANEGRNGSYTHADVWIGDFSTFSTPGEYVVVVEGIGCSFPFTIGVDAYREAFTTTTRALYHNRCGIALESQYTDWTRGRCHHPDDHTTVFQSTWRKSEDGNEHNGAFENLPTHSTGEETGYWGGWHDAADWDRGSTHLDASMNLLLAYECFPSKFDDNDLNIPESGNGIPDIIDEAKWTVDFFKRMQKDHGGVCGGIETTGHPKGALSVEDADDWYAYAPEAWSSYKYAYAAAALAYCLKLAGKESMVSEYVESAKKAFDWAEAYVADSIKVTDCTKEEEGCQSYDTNRLRALVWLYKVTGEDTYQQQFKADQHITKRSDWLYKFKQWRQVRSSIEYAMITGLDNIDQALQDTLKAAVLHWADLDRISYADKRSFCVGFHWWQPTLVGQVTTPDVEPLMAAFKLTGEKKYLDYLYASCDYYLGANQLNMCWVPGIGSRTPTIADVMHLDSWHYHGDKGLVPGIVPYGPNVFEYTNQCYPVFPEWPPHERWFGNRYKPITNEFTVHQTVAPSAGAYAFAMAAADAPTPAKQPRGSMQRRAAAAIRLTRGASSLSFDLGGESRYEVRVMDLRGATLSTKRGVSAAVSLSTRSFAPGTYLYRVRAAGRTLEGRMMVAR